MATSKDVYIYHRRSRTCLLSYCCMTFLINLENIYSEDKGSYQHETKWTVVSSCLDDIETLRSVEGNNNGL